MVGMLLTPTRDGVDERVMRDLDRKQEALALTPARRCHAVQHCRRRLWGAHRCTLRTPLPRHIRLPPTVPGTPPPTHPTPPAAVPTTAAQPPARPHQPAHPAHLQAGVEAQPLPQVVPQLAVRARGGLDAARGALRSNAAGRPAGRERGGRQGRAPGLGCGRSRAVARLGLDRPAPPKAPSFPQACTCAPSPAPHTQPRAGSAHLAGAAPLLVPVVVLEHTLVGGDHVQQLPALADVVVHLGGRGVG